MHKTVLLQEAVDGLLAPQKAGNDNIVVVDATFGGGGHSKEICKRYPGIKIIALDQDKSAFKNARHKFTGPGCDITFVNDNFRNLDKVLKAKRIKAIDGIIFDLGLSSDQLENSGRGFSFMKNEPLLMTMKENPAPDEITAYDVVNSWSEKSLADIIFGYGEERFGRRIARAIVQQRKQKKIKTSFDLVEVIRKAVPERYRRGRLHFATRTFQAIRIAVNDELGALAEGLSKGFKFLNNSGRMSIISFHSLEDRIVKKFYKTKQTEGLAKLINKKVITARESEIKNNIRSRSAKLRILEKK
jgi:16S rRNA (cytosine1402-N4)-methyltransferase